MMEMQNGPAVLVVQPKVKATLGDGSDHSIEAFMRISSRFLRTSPTAASQ